MLIPVGNADGSDGMFTLTLMAALLIVGLSLDVAALYWVVNLFDSQQKSLARACLARLCLYLPPIVAGIAYFLSPIGEAPAMSSFLWPFLAIACLIGQFAVLGAIYRLSIGKTIAISLSLLGCNFVLAIGFQFAIRSTTLQNYQMEGLAMAPTLLGAHRIDRCPHCGGEWVVGEFDSAEIAGDAPDVEEYGICKDCRKPSLVEHPSLQHFQADRVFALGWLTPRRWDMVAYEPPHAPGMVWCGRIVGLPGEILEIREGAVYVNGEKMAPPPELSGLEYESELAPGATPHFIAPSSPQRLSAEQYCILGDFSKRSTDSRYLGPVPRRNLKGVITVCYWPPSRWRTWR